MNQYRFTQEESPKPEDVYFLIHNLVAFNTTRVGSENYHPLTIFLRDANDRIVGGINAYTIWEWLFISHLWIDDALRGAGFGQQLVAAAEAEAVRRGCLHALLDTFSFQARGFYEKLGYEVFGVLDEFPKGHSRYYLQKRDLNRAAESLAATASAVEAVRTV